MIRIQKDKIIPENLVNEVRNREAGAIVTFFGTVRSRDETSDNVIGLIYESYEEMAIKKINEIVDEAGKKYPIMDVSIVQRVGRVNLSEDSIGIAVSSEH